MAVDNSKTKKAWPLADLEQEVPKATARVKMAGSVASTHFVVIDGLRGIAAMLVFMYHVCLYVKFWNDSPLSRFLTNHAYLAVDCFFVISGFVISHAFDAKIARGMSFLTFMKHRVIRLYPMIVIGICLGLSTLLALWLQSRGTPLWRFAVAGLSGLLLVPTTALISIRPYLFPINSAYWSLSFEMLLYIVYALTFPFLRGRRILMVLGVSAVLLAVASLINGGLNVGYMKGLYLPGFARVTFSFVAGMVLHRFGHLIRLPVSPVQVPYLPYLSIALLFLVILNPIPASGLYDLLAVLIIMPVATYLATFPGGWPGFEKGLTVLGEISYPLYAVHFPLVLIFSHTLAIFHVSPWITGIATLTFTLSVATLSYYVGRFYDVPVRKYLSRVLLTQKKVS